MEESGKLGVGEGRGVGVGVGGGEAGGKGASLEVVVMGSGKEPLVEVVKELEEEEMDSGKAFWVVEERSRCSCLLRFQMGG